MSLFLAHSCIFSFAFFLPLLYSSGLVLLRLGFPFFRELLSGRLLRVCLPFLFLLEVSCG